MDEILRNDNVLISAVNYTKDICKNGIGNDLGKMKVLHFLVQLNLNRSNNYLNYHQDIFKAADINEQDKREYYRIIEVKTW